MTEEKRLLIEDLTLGELQGMDLPKLKSYFIRTQQDILGKIDEDTLLATAIEKGVRKSYDLTTHTVAEVTQMRRGKGIVDTFTYEGTLEEVLVQFFKKDQSLTYINDSWIDWNDSKFIDIFKDHFYGKGGIGNYAKAGGNMD